MAQEKSSANDISNVFFILFFLFFQYFVIESVPPSCHPEHREGSVCIHFMYSRLCIQILHFVQNDKVPFVFSPSCHPER